jgi:hypothetical protein
MRTPRGSRWAVAAGSWVALLLVMGAGPAQAIPSFARQTKLPCSACHTQFPELNEFGRIFKLNGYTLRAIESIEDSTDGRQSLSLNLMPIVSIMAQASATEVSRTVPGSQNGSILLPDQLSVFLAGGITPQLGSFIQVTYDPQSGLLALDNTSIRFATDGALFKQPTVFGLSLNNNPTVQDLWNDTPAWGFPFASSSAAPAPAAGSMVDGGLAQEVVGLSGYAYVNSLLYAELGAYRSSPLGAARPLAATDSGVINGVAPYWRLAFTPSVGIGTLEVGTYGMWARRQPAGFVPGGASDRYTDLALDAELQTPAGLTLAGTWIHESRSLDASVAEGAASVKDQTLNSFRVRATYHGGQLYAVHLMPFLISGTTDPTLYAPDAVAGSATGSPNSSGVVGELDYDAWENVRLSVQYTAYFKFNGGTSNYGAANSGRSASDNNTLYFNVWLMF